MCSLFFLVFFFSYLVFFVCVPFLFFLPLSFTILDSEPAVSDEAEGSSTDLKVIYLVPKDSDSQITIIHLYVTAESLIRRIEFIDHFDTRTTINISNISVDPLQPGQHEEIEQLFSFTPPEGTEIIRQ